MMSFRRNADLDTMSRDELVDYAAGLEERVIASQPGTPLDARANLQRVFGLSPNEARLLICMADGRVHSKDAYNVMMHDDQHDLPEPKIIDIHVSRLRKKLAATPITISTLWGAGYYIDDVEPLKAAMGGEAVAGTGGDVIVTPGAPRGGYGMAHGEARAKLVAHLRSIAVDGVAEITSRELSHAIGSPTGGATLIRNAEKSGALEVLRKPRHGGKWRLAVFDEDFA